LQYALDILYFLEYDIDEELPWHSTISRTKNLFPEDVFEQVNTIGIQRANKVMMMAVIAYNLKKYLKFSVKPIQSMAKSVSAFCSILFQLTGANLRLNTQCKFSVATFTYQLQIV